MGDLEEFVPWRDQAEGRIATLEAVTHEHTDKISQHGEVLVSIDEDLKDLKADFGVQKALIQAVHDDQSDHTARLTRLEDGVAKLKTDMVEVKTDMVEVKAGVQTIIGLLDREIDEWAE